MAPKSKITITVDAPSDTEVHVTVSPGQVAEDSGAGTSTDVQTKGGSKGKSKSQVDGEHSKDGKMDHDDSLSEGDWEEVKAEPSASSPIPPSHSPPEPHPPSHSPPDAQELPESRYKITRKAGERVHRESCRMLKHHGEHQVILPSLCPICMPDQNDLKELREQVEAILKSKLRESDFLERQSDLGAAWGGDFSAEVQKATCSAIGGVAPRGAQNCSGLVWDLGEAEKEQLKKQLENAKREAKDKEAQIEQLKNELQEAQQKAESRTTGQEEQRTEAETGASEAEVPKVSKASLKDYFEKNYKQGRLFDHEEYRHDPKDWCWVHTGLDVKVWQDALDLTQADDASDVQCLFHYTNELGFKNITDLRKTAVELFASLITTGEKANAWWGAGVYSVQKPPDEWPNLERLLDNNYRRMLKRDIDLKGREAAVKEYRSRVSFCIPILVNASMAYDVSKRRTPEMVKQGKPVGVNLAGMPLNEDGMPPRQCFVIRVDTEEEVGNARAVLMEAVRCRAKAIEERLGSEHFETLKASSRLANVLTARGDYAKAEPLCRRVLANYETATLREVQKLMETMYYAGDLAEAETLCRRAVTERERVLGEMHAETLLSVNDLGLVLWQQGKLKEAELFSRRGLEGRETLLGAMHPDTLESANNLALVLADQGKLEEAEGLKRRALAGFEAQLGANHPDTLMSVNNLAGLLKKQGKLQDAEGLFRRALAGSEAQLGARHPSTLTTVFNLAGLLEAKGGHAEARRAVAPSRGAE
ncbi:Kinesin light chain 4 (KLC 4) (Kinesin-like protein 8), partial [Durusdinium trenchii]